MKLKTKLLITFLILILAPIMFTALAFFGISRYQMTSFLFYLCTYELDMDS